MHLGVNAEVMGRKLHVWPIKTQSSYVFLFLSMGHKKKYCPSRNQETRVWSGLCTCYFLFNFFPKLFYFLSLSYICKVGVSTPSRCVRFTQRSRQQHT